MNERWTASTWSGGSPSGLLSAAILCVMTAGGCTVGPTDKSNDTDVVSETDQTETDDPGVVENVLYGVVRDEGGSPIANVLVTAGEVSTRTGPDGSYRMALAAGDLTVDFDVSGYLPVLLRARVADGGSTWLDATMLSVGQTERLDASVGGTMTTDSGAGIVVGAGSLVDGSGAPVTGPVDVSLTTIDPGLRSQVAGVSGSFIAERTDGSGTMLESFGMVDITIRDVQGQKLQVAPGSTLELTIPVSSAKACPDATVGFWSFDEIWREEGVASCAVDAVTNICSCTGEIPHMSAWNLDDAVPGTCIKGRLVDDGQPDTAEEGPMPWAGVYVEAFGTGVAHSDDVTKADGSFVLVMSINDTVTINVEPEPEGWVEVATVQTGNDVIEVPPSVAFGVLSEEVLEMCVDVGDIAVSSDILDVPEVPAPAGPQIQMLPGALVSDAGQDFCFSVWGHDEDVSVTCTADENATCCEEGDTWEVAAGDAGWRCGSLVEQSGASSVTCVVGEDVAASQLLVSSSCHPDDRLALEAIFNDLGGDGWLNSTGWPGGLADPESSCCDGWFGVACGDDNRVVDLYLADNNLRGDIPVEIAGMSFLQRLTFQGFLSGTLPEEFSQLSNLVQLRIAGDCDDPYCIEGQIPDSYRDLVLLEELSITGGALQGTLPSWLGEMSQLRYLSFQSNQLTGEIPTSLENLTNLEYLVVGANQLTGSIPAGLTSLSNLIEMELSLNQLTGTLPAGLMAMPSLEELRLSRNQLSGTIPDAVAGSGLLGLELGGNEFTGTVPASLGQLASLERLALNSNQLAGTIPTELGNLAALQVLSLDDNQLVGTIPTELGNLSNAYQVSLANNDLTGPLPDELTNLTGLAYLFVENNELSGVISEPMGTFIAGLSEYGLEGNAFACPYPSALQAYFDGLPESCAP